MDDEPGLRAAIDQLGAASTDWAQVLIRYRMTLVYGGFTTEAAEALTVQLDERLAFLALAPDPD